MLSGKQTLPRGVPHLSVGMTRENGYKMENKKKTKQEELSLDKEVEEDQRELCYGTKKQILKVKYSAAASTEMVTWEAR